MPTTNGAPTMTTDADRLARRAAEATFLAELPSDLTPYVGKWVRSVRVLRVGRFIPGGDGTYASAEALIEWRREHRVEYTTHTIVRRDELPLDDGSAYVCVNGHYFPGDPAIGFARASADLLIRSRLVEGVAGWVVDHLVDAGDLRSGLDRDEVVREVVDALAVD